MTRTYPDLSRTIDHGHRTTARHGADDQISPLPLIRMTARTTPRTELAAVPGGHDVPGGDGGHDVPAGDGWRAVVARTLVFLESVTLACAA